MIKNKLVTRADRLRELAEYTIPKFLGCSHKNIVCIIDAVEDDNRFWVIYEYIANAISLKKYKTDIKSLDFLNVLYQLADGLAYIHKRGIVHNDIKPENIMIKASVPFYIDFDLSCAMPGSGLHLFTCNTTRRGTPLYMAPEVVLGRVENHRASDIWSLGLVFYWLVTCKHPFKGTKDEVYDQILYDTIPHVKTDIPDLKILISEMLANDPEKRPTATQVRDRISEMIKHY